MESNKNYEKLIREAIKELEPWQKIRLDKVIKKHDIQTEKIKLIQTTRNDLIRAKNNLNESIEEHFTKDYHVRKAME